MKRAMRTSAKLAIVALLALGLEGCASAPMEYSEMPRKTGRSVVQNENQKPLQCVPYVREHSKIKIFGDAYTWWDKAEGKYPRGSAPEKGTVMVLHDYAGSEHGHVAVVRNLVSAREIRVDHANWLNDGSIYVNNPVLDVSADNDWSQVRVYNIKTGGWGSKVYPVRGFIGSGNNVDDDEDRPDLVARLVGGNPGIRALVSEIN
jgi:surface antigen